MNSLKDGLKSVMKKARGRSVTAHQGKPHISLPWVDPQERINILGGQGPLLQLGDVGAPTIDVPLDPAFLREKRALERHYKPHARNATHPKTKPVETGAGARMEKFQFSRRLSFDGGVTLGGPEYNRYSENSLIQDYAEEKPRGKNVKQTGRHFRSADGTNYHTGLTSIDHPSHGRLYCQRLGHDRPPDTAT